MNSSHYIIMVKLFKPIDETILIMDHENSRGRRGPSQEHNSLAMTIKYHVKIIIFWKRCLCLCLSVSVSVCLSVSVSLSLPPLFCQIKKKKKKEQVKQEIITDLPEWVFLCVLMLLFPPPNPASFVSCFA